MYLLNINVQHLFKCLGPCSSGCVSKFCSVFDFIMTYFLILQPDNQVTKFIIIWKMQYITEYRQTRLVNSLQTNSYLGQLILNLANSSHIWNKEGLFWAWLGVWVWFGVSWPVTDRHAAITFYLSKYTKMYMYNCIFGKAYVEIWSSAAALCLLTVPLTFFSRTKHRYVQFVNRMSISRTFSQM